MGFLNNSSQLFNKFLFLYIKNKILLNHVIGYILRSIPLDVKFECHHFVAMGLQLTFHHIVSATRHLEHAQLELM